MTSFNKCSTIKVRINTYLLFWLYTIMMNPLKSKTGLKFKTWCRGHRESTELKELTRRINPRPPFLTRIGSFLSTEIIYPSCFFNLSLRLDATCDNKVFRWKAQNQINGLQYGNGGLSCWTFYEGKEQINQIISVTDQNRITRYE